MKNLSKFIRILAIAPSTRGFGFAILERPEKLVDWGVKRVQGEKNSGTIARVKEMIVHYQPDVIVLEDHLAKPRRSIRIQMLSKKIVALAKSQKVTVALFSRNQVRGTFFADGHGTKQALAEILAAHFREELASRLPPKRRPWMSEDQRMYIFDSVALAMVFMSLKQGYPIVTQQETCISTCQKQGDENNSLSGQFA